MNAPKMLPWLASTAGIELERVEQLWRTASEHALSVAGESESSRYLGLVHEKMMDLVEHEMLTGNPVEDAPWLMIQAHLSVAPMILADNFAQVTASTRQAVSRWMEKRHTTA